MNRRLAIIVVAFTLMLALLACGGGGAGKTQTPEPTAVPKASATVAAQPTQAPPEATRTLPPKPTQLPKPTKAAKPTLTPGTAAAGIRQWAISASASSEYGDPNWAAKQATGKPDTPMCGDHDTAWASASSDGEEWIELSYDAPVMPTEVNIIQSFNPSQIVKVELIDMVSEYHEIYSAQPAAVDECPYRLSIPVDADYQVAGLRITIDQSVLGVGWNEIDAVQLVGVPDRPVIPEPTTNATFEWRAGGSGDAADSIFTTLHGMDASDGKLYVADEMNGVYAFDLEGNLEGQIAPGEVGYVVDVKADSWGSIFVADAGLHQVSAFDEDGEFYMVFGGVGIADGEFGSDSPAALAIGPVDGNVYVLDVNQDADGKDIVRVQVFTSDTGDFISSFLIEEDFGATAMDFGPDDNLYILGRAGYILKLSPESGEVLDRLGEEAIGDSYTLGLSIDGEGNFYVTTQVPAGAVKLDADGNLLETFGIEATSTDEGWPEGEFMFPAGIAVTKDGSLVFIGDTSGDYTFITAFKYP